MLNKSVLCVLWLSRYCLLTAFGPVRVSLARAISWIVGRAVFCNAHFASLSQIPSLSSPSDLSQGLLSSCLSFSLPGLGRALSATRCRGSGAAQDTAPPGMG